MSQQERRDWDERFRAGSHLETAPDPFLLQLEEYRDLFPETRQALDIACGGGRNAVWLAEKGWHVAACDISTEGLKRAKALADERGVQINFFAEDLEIQNPKAAPFIPNQFDLIICFFYLQRELFPAIKAALRPKGLLVYKTYTVDQQPFPGKPSHPTHFLRHQELLDEFRDFRVLLYQEVMEGRGMAQIIARKP